MPPAGCAAPARPVGFLYREMACPPGRKAGRTPWARALNLILGRWSRARARRGRTTGVWPAAETRPAALYAEWASEPVRNPKSPEAVRAGASPPRVALAVFITHSEHLS